jgi:hypothetical protein
MNKGAHVKELRTQIEIWSTPDRVWQVLTNLDKYPEWNPFIYRAIGTARPGEKVDITVRTDSADMVLHCKVIKVEPGRELRWKYHVGMPFLFGGEHSFIIEPLTANKIRFVDREVFNGLFVSIQSRNIDTKTKQGFEAMDRALKMRAEQN